MIGDRRKIYIRVYFQYTLNTNVLIENTQTKFSCIKETTRKKEQYSHISVGVVLRYIYVIIDTD